ncbi:MAG: tetratricopeptide repeat protein [Candidatus Latescibacterota bacterium]|nr:tetratricopeptide repeat protein [Candidatus Latescibacterota bacterium]
MSRLFHSLVAVRHRLPTPALASVAAMFVVQSHCNAPSVDHAQLAVHFLEREQYGRALREAERAVRERPDETHAHMISAFVHAGLDATEEAVQSIERALRLDPDDSRLFSTLRSLCADADRIDLARGLLQELRDEWGEDNWHVRVNLGWALRVDGEPKQALELLEPAVSEPDSTLGEEAVVFAHIQLGSIYVELERFADAARVLEGALMLAPNDPRLLVSVGECHLRQGEGAIAEGFFERALDSAINLEAIASRIAVLHYSAGDRRRAINYYERGVRRRPSPLTLNNLAWTYAEEGIELERAWELSLRAVKSDVDNVVYLDTYAEVLFQLGHVSQAAAVIQRCLEIEPKAGEHYEYLEGQLTRFQTGAEEP